ncbi:MAG: hypothetical protein ICV74_00930 [Thermoleophilia bacterium]|nr:hypothetical protein [Thermoleophilia bacterium]
MLEAARVQWEEGVRRIEAARRDVPRYQHLMLLVDAVSDELRRRVGQTFTLADLARAYDGAEDWVREVVLDASPRRGGTAARDSALVQDAAFGRYARGATDYRP